MQVKIAFKKWINFLKTDTFFYIIVGIFFISALWLVFTARYPMAFDENYHYGIIQQYAKQWSPFFTTQPAGSEALGDITRYPSYLFHYAMSFPYRLISLFTDSDIIKIVILRIMNVGMLASSLWIFKKLFKEMKLSESLANLSILVFVLIPIVPFLGAQISYDNVIIPLTALTLLGAVRVLTPLRKGEFNSNWFLAFLITGMIAALMKYTYLPIFVFLFLYVTAAIMWSYRKNKFAGFTILKNNYLNVSLLKKVFIVLGLVLGLLLCLERYGVNVVKYKNPVPDCGQVLSEQSCNQYGPWKRDFKLKQRKVGTAPNWKIRDYNKVWVQTTLNEFYFAINYNYFNEPPLKVLYVFAQVALVIGLLAVIINIKKVFKNPNLRLILLVSIFYTAILWIDNYMKFYNVHWPVAIHGRYLLPLVPAIAILMGASINYTLQLLPYSKRKIAQVAGVAVLIVGIGFGGGTLTYIARSDTDWYWQNNVAVRLNSFIKSGLVKVLK